jgi:hypothetical protein
MWEVRAADGRLDDLLRWIAGAVAGRNAQVYRSVDQDAERVVVMLEVDEHDGSTGPAAPADPSGVPDSPDLPDPPAGLAARRAGSWVFDRVG